MNFRSTCLVLRLIAFAVVLLTANSIQAQEKPPPATDVEKETEQRQEFEKKTIALLNEIASAAWGLKLPENRLFVMTNTAELLWTVDEKRARSLYWEALNSLNLIAPQVATTSDKMSKADRDKLLQSYLSMFTLRRNLLTQVAQRDAQLALDMLRATRQVPPRLGLEFPLPDDRQLEQEIAAEVAAHDPARALQLARESLAKGLSLQLLRLLHELNQQDPEKASQFASDIIAKLRSTNVASDQRASLIGVHLLQNSRVPEHNRARLSAGSVGLLKLNDEQRRDLVDILTNAALTVSANASLLSQLWDLMPDVQEFFPERRVALERKMAAFNQTLNKEQREDNIYNRLIVEGRADEMIRMAATASDDNRLMLYRQAAIIAVARGSTDSFRDLVSKEVKGEGEQRKLLDLLDSEEISAAVYRKQIDELKKLLPNIRRKEERARALAELALMLKEKGEDAEASSLLDEAATLVKTDLKSETQTNALLGLLCAYAVVDPPKAFALAERIIDEANDQISLLLLVDRVVKSGGVKKGEIVLDFPGIMPLSYLVFRYGKGVAALARADFNRTRLLADRFGRNELRVLARLLIVKGIRTPQPATMVTSN